MSQKMSATPTLSCSLFLWISILFSLRYWSWWCCTPSKKSPPRTIFSRKVHHGMKMTPVWANPQHLFFLPRFIQSRPINLSQRASPAAFTVTKRCAMAHQTPHPLTRCCGAQTKVLSVDTETARDIPRQKPLTLLEGKMVSCDVVVLAVDAILCLILNGCYKENAAS